MATSVTSVVNHFPKPQNGFTTTLSSSISSGATIVPLSSVSGYTNGDIAVFVVDPSDAVKKQTFTGIIDTANVRVTSVVWTAGTNQAHIAGATVVDYATATHIGMMSKGILVAHNQDGTIKNNIITADNLVSNAVTEAKINAGAVTAIKIADFSVVPAKLAQAITLTNGTTITPNMGSRINIVTGLGVNTTFNSPTNFSYDGQSFILRIKDNGTSRTLAFGGQYRAVGVTLPTATTANKNIYLGIVLNSTDGFFDIISVAREA